MKREEAEKILMDTAMKIIADNGLASFSMRQVTDACGINESLMYRYFDTKDNMLKVCYESLNKKIIDLHKEASMKELMNGDFLAGFKKMYYVLMDLLISEKHATLFYFEYREFLNINSQNATNLSKSEVLSNILKNMTHNMGHDLNEVQISILLTYLIETIGMFAKRIIREDIPDNGDTREYIWKLLINGMVGILS